MKRWQQDFSVSRREWKKHRRYHVECNIERGPVGRDPWQVDCTCDEQVGRFRKQDAWDCGITRCRKCHGDKFPKRQLTQQEKCANLKLIEGIAEAAEELRGKI